MVPSNVMLSARDKNTIGDAVLVIRYRCDRRKKANEYWQRSNLHMYIYLFTYVALWTRLAISIIDVFNEMLQ